MAYLFVSLAVLIGVIWALVVFPSFRVVAVIVVLLGAVVYLVARQKEEQEQKEQAAKNAQEDEQRRVRFEAEQKDHCSAEKKRWTIVPASQIEIRDPSLTPSQFYGVVNDDYTLTASAKNKSKSKVTALRLTVTALDCPTQNARAADCDVVGHSEGTFDEEIPGGEVRQINGKMAFRAMPKPRGVFSPKFAVSGVRAAIEQSDGAHYDLLSEFMGYKCD
jgi:hypothetical protein